MSMQTKEVNINNLQYRVRMRGFDSQCEFLKLFLDAKAKNETIMPSSIIVVSKVQVYDNAVKNWRNITHEDLDNIAQEDGFKLFKEVLDINKRQVVTEQDFQNGLKADNTSSSVTST